MIAESAAALNQATKIVVTTVKQEYPFTYSCPNNPVTQPPASAVMAQGVGSTAGQTTIQDACAVNVRNAIMQNTDALAKLARGFQLEYGLTGKVTVKSIVVVKDESRLRELKETTNRKLSTTSTNFKLKIDFDVEDVAGRTTNLLAKASAGTSSGASGPASGAVLASAIESAFEVASLTVPVLPFKPANSGTTSTADSLGQGSGTTAAPGGSGSTASPTGTGGGSSGTTAPGGSSGTHTGPGGLKPPTVISIIEVTTTSTTTVAAAKYVGGSSTSGTIRSSVGAIMFIMVALMSSIV